MLKTKEKFNDIITGATQINNGRHMIVAVEDMEWLGEQVSEGLNAKHYIQQLQEAGCCKLEEENVNESAFIHHILHDILKHLPQSDEHVSIQGMFHGVLDNLPESLEEVLSNELQPSGFTIDDGHGVISAEVNEHGGVWISVNDLKLVLVEYDKEREAHVIRAYNQDMLHDDYEYSQEIKPMHKQLNEKLDKLIKRKEKELNLYIVDVVIGPNKYAHILAKRESDNSFVVWTSPYTGEYKTSYVDFYSGMYDMPLTHAVEELNRRTAI